MPREVFNPFVVGIKICVMVYQVVTDKPSLTAFVPAPSDSSYKRCEPRPVLVATSIMIGLASFDASCLVTAYSSMYDRM